LFPLGFLLYPQSVKELKQYIDDLLSSAVSLSMRTNTSYNDAIELSSYDINEISECTAYKNSIEERKNMFASFGNLLKLLSKS